MRSRFPAAARRSLCQDGRALEKRLPQKTVGFLGAPLVDGQNLEGADLAPMALRHAGLKKLIEKQGYGFQDCGDLDFDAHYEELGLRRKSQKHTKAYWQRWMDSGTAMSFAEWSQHHRHPHVRHKEGEINLDSTETEPLRRTESEKDLDVHDRVVNAHLIGPALGLVYKECSQILQRNQFLLTVGGDHSIATGTLAAITEKYPDVAVVWVDAHGDANTPETSPSLHYHGMPAAHVMGWFRRQPKGFEWMGERQKYIEESHLAYIGLRDIDPVEGKMLRGSDCHIYTMRDVDKLGIAAVIERVIKSIDPNGNRPLHLSFDVDSVDPQFAPGTGTCARGGLTYRECHYICEELALTKRLVSMDLVEINPGLDKAPPPSASSAGSDGGAMHGDDPDMNRTTPTVQLGAELVLSALGKNILAA
jgi:arginase